MVTAKQTRTARTSVKTARHAVASKKMIAQKPAKTKMAPGKRGAVGAQRTSARSGAGTTRTRAELYEIAKRKDLPGRSRMGRDELARKLGMH
jgi:hypothetical protein